MILKKALWTYLCGSILIGGNAVASTQYNDAELKYEASHDIYMLFLENPPNRPATQSWKTDYDGVNARATYTFVQGAASVAKAGDKRLPKSRLKSLTAIFDLKCGKDGYSFGIAFPRNFPSLPHGLAARWIKDGNDTGIFMSLLAPDDQTSKLATILGVNDPPLSKAKFNQIVRYLYDTGFAAFDARDKFGVSVDIHLDSTPEEDTARHHALGLIRSACE